MRTSLVLLVMTIGCAATAAQDDALKTPAGCRAAKDAKASHDGYASRIIHDKTGIEMILVKPGKFIMGTSKYRSNDGAHPVTITRPYYMAKTETTNAQFARFVKAKPDYDGEKDTDLANELYLLHMRGKSIMPDGDDYPVVWVSWKNAQAFCQWAGLKLPTETQWEYACRAGSTTLYYYGDDPKKFHDHGWAHNARDHENHYTHPVAKKLPNDWGFHDMLGNVWEWVEDDWREGFVDAPEDDTARVVDGAFTKVVRGGSWGNDTKPHNVSCSARFNSAPTNAGPEFGFRVVLQLDGTDPQ